MRIVAIVCAAVFWFGAAEAQERTITVASTTSTEQSGCSATCCPSSRKPRASVKVVAVGTGQALDIGLAATQTWSSSTTGQPKTSSWPKDRA